ncbi:MAG: hypothetical protein CM1200mP33_3800 [Chloroflexota bacterium]|nr:MAG: hypothetical protein CM1200mP33_3800 [Chloroflexota bacterium]
MLYTRVIQYLILLTLINLTLFLEVVGIIRMGNGRRIRNKTCIPRPTVIAFVGDGTGMMSVQALWTASVNKIPITYIMCNNGA